MLITAVIRRWYSSANDRISAAPPSICAMSYDSTPKAETGRSGGMIAWVVPWAI